jgi:hypothetical protein
MKKWIGLLLMVAAIFCGLYVGLWVFFIGGIVDIIDEIKSPEFTSGFPIAWGILKIFLSSVAGWTVAIVMFCLGFVLADS